MERIRGWEVLRGPSEAACTSACQFTGHKRGFPLGQVLGGGDVVPCDLGLLWCSCWQLFVLYLRFCHVVVTRVKVLLLQENRRFKLNKSGTNENRHQFKNV